MIVRTTSRSVGNSLLQCCQPMSKLSTTSNLLSGIQPQKRIPSILKSIRNIDSILEDKDTLITKLTSGKKKDTKQAINGKKKSTEETLIDGPYLNTYLSSDSLMKPTDLTKNEISYLNRFINEAKIGIDWSIYEYTKIPGEEERMKREEELQDKLESSMDDIQEKSENSIPQFDDRVKIIDSDIEELDKYEKEPTKQRDTDAIDPETMKEGRIKYLRNKQRKKQQEEVNNNLPEVIFLGRCNVGKSSLINAILTNNKLNAIKYARVKQTAGYTPCLNFYNVGGLFRLVDSPGYGVKGHDWQGELVFQYLMNRRAIKNCYLLLDGKVGLNQYDEMILGNLVELGIQFDVIFNKIDKIKAKDRMRHLTQLIKGSVLNDLSLKPRYYFVNSVDDKMNSDLKFRSGVNEVRFSMLQSCGYTIDSNLKPKQRKKKVDENDEKIKRSNIRNALKFTQSKAKTNYKK